LHGVGVFLKIDLRLGYHELRIRPENISKLLLELDMVTTSLLQCPFGHTNAIDALVDLYE